MPTPADAVAISPSISPIEASSSRASFASCPPEDEREHHAPREERIDRVDTPQLQDGPAELEPTELFLARPRRSETNVRNGVSAPGNPEHTVVHEKGEHVEDAGITEDPISAVLSPELSGESDANRLVQSSGAAAMSGPRFSSTEEPLYLTFPRDPFRLLPCTTSSFLRPGSKFRGTQRSDRQVYDVQVEVKDVNMADSFVCGYLRIQGLTDDHPTLTTFFEGEIIGPKYLFKTTHPSWGSSEKVDLQHWARFPAWRPLAKSAKSPNFTLKNYAQREHLFMRWKEYFLVPDHRVKTITGASFEGFYYICFNQVEGSVSGIYFHAKSERYQQLELRHVDDRGCVGAMEFR